MKEKQLLKKLIIIIVAFVLVTLISSKTYANSIIDLIEPIEYTQEYQEWLQLEEIDKMYDQKIEEKERERE